jgi:hypothetical protein
MRIMIQPTRGSRGARAGFRAPKSIAGHPAVEECLCGTDEGFDDYKYDVWLKEGWVFLRGNGAGYRGGRFNRVEDFRHAEPVKIEDYQA